MPLIIESPIFFTLTYSDMIQYCQALMCCAKAYFQQVKEVLQKSKAIYDLEPGIAFLGNYSKTAVYFTGRDRTKSFNFMLCTTFRVPSLGSTSTPEATVHPLDSSKSNRLGFLLLGWYLPKYQDPHQGFSATIKPLFLFSL